MTQDTINEAIYQSATLTLALILTREKIPHSIRSFQGGFQFLFPWCNGDVICHSFSYGGRWGNFESYGFPWDADDVSEFCAGDMATKIIKYYHETVSEDEGE